MINLIFTILMFLVFGKLFLFGLKVSWGITKFILTIVFLPLILIGMVIGGLIYVALPILIIIGIISIVTSMA